MKWTLSHPVIRESSLFPPRQAILNVFPKLRVLCASVVIIFYSVPFFPFALSITSK
jgi:hypothetical protein